MLREFNAQEKHTKQKMRSAGVIALPSKICKIKEETCVHHQIRLQRVKLVGFLVPLGVRERA